MHLILVAALLAACGADKLDRTYLPPASASTAGGSPGSLQTPFRTLNQGLGSFPKGSYSNDFEGVVVDAATSGTRASGGADTGLGGPRITYGSTDSKVGDAAFTSDAAFPRVGVHSGVNNQDNSGANQQIELKPERVQSSRDRVSNIVKYESDVGPSSFNYAFETDNGIVAEENGIEVNGVKAQGGYSYTGDDGQVYSVTYTADEDGYRPKGDHLPTPPPIPAEILKSLEKNAQDEAAGVVDDGSYDAHKYNTGEDYTKNDNGNGHYNGGLPNRLGNRPQSDPIASGSFISQNNEGSVKPNQFASNPSFDTSKYDSPNGNNRPISNGNIPTQNAQIGFGLASKNEYLPPSNSFSQNRRPILNNSPLGFSDTQTGFVGSTAGLNINSGVGKNENTGIPAFVPLGQQKLQNDRPKKPQPNFPIFGKPTLIDSTLSIRDPFASSSSDNKFTQSKQPNQKPSATGGSFQVVSGNIYSSKNEYLPPHRQNNRPNSNNENQRYQDITVNQPIKQFPGSQFSNRYSPSTTAFASVPRPIGGNQSSQQYSSNQNPQHLSFTNQIGQPPSNRPQTTLNSGLSGTSSFNGAPTSQPQYKPSIFASQPSTLQPQIEITTPLTFSSDIKKGLISIPIRNAPDSSSLMGSSNLPSLGSQPTNGIVGQYSFNSNIIQAAKPTSSSKLSDQSITPGYQNAGNSLIPVSNFGPQLQLQNNLPVNGQYSSSTQRPTFGQYNQHQGSDNSYYYNIPAKPFNTPVPRPQGSIFPSSAVGQPFKVTQTPFANGPQLSDTPEKFSPSQINTPANDVRYPKPSSLAPVAPTLPTTKDEQNKNIIQSQINKFSPISLFAPKPTVSANRNQFGQFEIKPFEQIDQFNKGSQGFNQPASSFTQTTDSIKPIVPGADSLQLLTGTTKPTTNQAIPSEYQQTQQYDGEVYEYKKPPQTLTTPQNDATGQFGPPSSFGTPVTTSQISHSSHSGAYKPNFQSGSQFTQKPLSFSPNYQMSQDNPALNGSSSAPTQINPGQFNSAQSNPIKTSQTTQGASKFPPTYNNQTPPCCKQVGQGPLQSSQADEQDRTSPFGDQNKPIDFNQKGSEQQTKPVPSASNFAGVAENFGGPRKPPSFDQTGYHY